MAIIIIVRAEDNTNVANILLKIMLKYNPGSKIM